MKKYNTVTFANLKVAGNFSGALNINKNEELILNIESKNEIEEIFEKYSICKDESLTSDSELKWIFEHIEEHVPFEKPDSYLGHCNVVYGIEHFRISLYRNGKKGDVGEYMKGARKDRDERLKRNEEVKSDCCKKLEPSIDNFTSSIRGRLEEHSKSFDFYMQNLLGMNAQDKDIHLVIFMEDTSEPGGIIYRKDKLINPFNIKGVAEAFVPYKDKIWAIILVYGHDRERCLTGITLQELLENYKAGNLLEDSELKPVDDKKRWEKISKEGSSKDMRQSVVFIDGNFCSSSGKSADIFDINDESIKCL